MLFQRLVALLIFELQWCDRREVLRHFFLLVFVDPARLARDTITPGETYWLRCLL